MRILYIWDSDYPWDVRVEKICASLTEAGHQLHIAARNLKKRPKYEEYENLYIHRLKFFRSEKLNSVYSYPLFFSPIWLRFIDRTIKHHHIDLVIVRDLPLAITGIWGAHKNGLPVVFDMAEDYAALNKAIWDAAKKKGMTFFVRHPFVSRLIEKYVFKRCDHILVVVDEARDMLVEKGVEKGRITIVSNTPTMAMSEAVKPRTESPVIQIIRSGKSAIYVGGIQKGRGIHVVIEALPDIVKEIPDFLFVVVGDGYAAASLKALVVSRGVGDHVLFTGWIDHTEVAEYIKASDVGIIPHVVNEHKNSTVPNKLFDYMQNGLPVVASDAKPLKRIIEAEGCGLVFRSEDPRSLAQAVVSILKSDHRYGVNGLHAVQAKYNWTLDSEKLKKVIAHFDH